MRRALQGPRTYIDFPENACQSWYGSQADLTMNNLGFKVGQVPFTAGLGGQWHPRLASQNEVGSSLLPRQPIISFVSQGHLLGFPAGVLFIFLPSTENLGLGYGPDLHYKCVGFLSENVARPETPGCSAISLASALKQREDHQDGLSKWIFIRKWNNEGAFLGKLGCTLQWKFPYLKFKIQPYDLVTLF